jgi:hypothetical protein
MLHGSAQLVEHGLDIRLLHRGLLLNEVRQFLRTDEMVVIHGSRVVLAVTLHVV